MQRIIDGVLYDTQKSDFIGSKTYNTYSKKKQRSPLYTNFYIAKNGVIFETKNGDIGMSNTEDITQLKRIMEPKIYAKYFPLIIPGEGEYPEEKPKKGIKTEKVKTRLDNIE